METSKQEPLLNFSPDNSIWGLLGFNLETKFEKYNSSPNQVDILSFDNILLDTNIVQGITVKGKRSGIIHNCTLDVHPDHEYIESS